MKIPCVALLLGACTTATESQYPSSSGPMGVGQTSEAGVQSPPEEPLDTGDTEQSDTGADTGRP